MATIDPILQKLVADTSQAEESVKLDLYLPSGRLVGWTTSHFDFALWANEETGHDAGEVGAIEVADFDPEYVHLKVQPLTMPGQTSSADVLRIKLSGVVAWSVGN